MVCYTEFVKIPRALLPLMKDFLLPGKVLVLYGPRQVGKTTLAHDLMAALPLRGRFINADEVYYRDILASQDRRRLGELLEDVDFLVIDEAQRVPNVGLNLKIMVDSFPRARILATGSASFDLANKISEPLTGRKITLTLYPVAYAELQHAFGRVAAHAMLERWLVWGGYPAIVTEDSLHMRTRLLGELVGSYLYRDVLELDGLRRAEKIVDLLRLLAFQIGYEVSLSELASRLALNRQTVERYLDLLEKVFVIFRVNGFSRNLRKEITRNARYYFYDNGVRNALIQNFNPLHLRHDAGQLWENFLMMERRKANQVAGRQVNGYFWRTYDRKEIDYVEEYGGALRAFEFKWGRRSVMRPATRRVFLSAYPEAQLQTVTPENFEAFVVPPEKERDSDEVLPPA